MNDKTVERVALVTFIIVGLFIVTGLILLGWGFIEFVEWITSK